MAILAKGADLRVSPNFGLNFPPLGERFSMWCVCWRQIVESRQPAPILDRPRENHSVIEGGGPSTRVLRF